MNFFLSESIQGLLDRSNLPQAIIWTAQQVAKAEDCKGLEILVDEKSLSMSRAILDGFQKELFPSQHEVQVSNGDAQKVRLSTGLYEASISSFVTGATLGKKEFEVTPKTTSISINL